MNSANFPEATRSLVKPKGMTDEECGSLRVFEDDGVLISCWKMSWRERFAALLFGTVWLRVWSGYTQPPVSLECKKTVFIKVVDSGS